MAVESYLVKSFFVLYTFAINTNGFFSSITINSPISLAIFQLIVSPFFTCFEHAINFRERQIRVLFANSEVHHTAAC